MKKLVICAVLIIGSNAQGAYERASWSEQWRAFKSASWGMPSWKVMVPMTLLACVMSTDALFPGGEENRPDVCKFSGLDAFLLAGKKPELLLQGCKEYVAEHYGTCELDPVQDLQWKMQQLQEMMGVSVAHNG